MKLVARAGMGELSELAAMPDMACKVNRLQSHQRISYDQKSTQRRPRVNRLVAGRKRQPMVPEVIKQ